MPVKRKSPAGGRASLNFVRSSKNKGFYRQRQELSFDAVNAAAMASLLSLLTQWLPDGIHTGREYVALNPTRSDRSKGSFKINTKTGRWCDFATGDKGGDPVSLAAYIFGLTQKQALHRVAQDTGVYHA